MKRNDKESIRQYVEQNFNAARNEPQSFANQMRRDYPDLSYSDIRYALQLAYRATPGCENYVLSGRMALQSYHNGE